MFRLILCVCLLVVSIEASAESLWKLMDADRQFELITTSTELIVRILVLIFFVSKYQKHASHPDLLEFFTNKNFIWKYLFAIFCSYIVSTIFELSFQEITISVNAWIYAIVSISCLGLFLFLLFYVFKPDQYAFQWKMDWGDVRLREIIGPVESPEEENQIQIGEQLIEEIQDQFNGQFTFQKRCEMRGKLVYAYELTWSKEGIKGYYWTPNTFGLVSEAQSKAARHLKDEGIDIASNDLKYVPEKKK